MSAYDAAVVHTHTRVNTNTVLSILFQQCWYTNTYMEIHLYPMFGVRTDTQPQPMFELDVTQFLF